MREALEAGRKRKRGSLRRYRPRDPPCESVPVEPVAALKLFKRVRRERYRAYLDWLGGEEDGGEGDGAGGGGTEKKNAQVAF